VIGLILAVFPVWVACSPSPLAGEYRADASRHGRAIAAEAHQWKVILSRDAH
jgi:hypothetical protein